MKTRFRRPKGRGVGLCVPRIPDSGRHQPAAAPARTAGSHRQVSALPEPSNLSCPRSPVPDSSRPCPDGLGLPFREGSPSRPRFPTRGAAARRAPGNTERGQVRPSRTALLPSDTPCPAAPVALRRSSRRSPGGAALRGRGERRQLLGAGSFPNGLYLFPGLCLLSGGFCFSGGVGFFKLLINCHPCQA